ncbi:MAG: histidine kinase [Gemmatimonadetes bacterium]|nr:histidine kinase [Gemmatimonadota bacterium]
MRLSPRLLRGGAVAALAALAALAAPRAGMAAPVPGPVVRVTTVQVCRARSVATPPTDSTGCVRRAVDAVDPQGTALWLLADVTVPVSVATSRAPMALLMQAMASTALYWDGVRISASGRPALEQPDEVPGQFVHIAPLRSDELRPGVHRLAVLLSNHHGPLRVSMPVHVLALAPLELLRDGVGSGGGPILLALGALLLAAVYFAAVSLAGTAREPGRGHTALLAALIACALTQGVAELWRALLPISYVAQVWRLIVILLAATGLGASLVAYTTRRFAPTWSARAVLGYAVVAGAVWLLPGFDVRTLLLLSTAAMIALAASGWAAWRREPGAGAVSCVLLLLIAAGVVEQGAFLDRELFVGLTVLTLVLLLDHVRETRRLQAAATAAQQQAQQQVQRLELELLRRRLTPHWLLNMLNALTAWIEEEPATAVRMVGLLGDEFHRLAHPIDAPLIAARDELAACERLLALMSLRSGRTFTLDATGVAPDLPVPPGVLHTLVENALTHGGYRRGAVFTIRQQGTPGAAVLTFEAPPADSTERAASQAAASQAAAAHDAPHDPAEGFGLTYVRARLQAAFGEHATLSDGPASDGGWRTVLRLGGAAA